MAKFERIVNELSRWADWVAGWGLVTIMVITIANIAARRLRIALVGSEDVITSFVPLTTALALAYCAVRGGHVDVGMLTERLSQRSQAVIAVVTGLIGAAIMALVTWQLAVYAADMAASGEVLQTIKIPYYPLIYVVSFSFFLMFLVVMVQLLKSILTIAGRSAK